MGYMAAWKNSLINLLISRCKNCKAKRCTTCKTCIEPKKKQGCENRPKCVSTENDNMQSSLRYEFPYDDMYEALGSPCKNRNIGIYKKLHWALFYELNKLYKTSNFCGNDYWISLEWWWWWWWWWWWQWCYSEWSEWWWWSGGGVVMVRGTGHHFRVLLCTQIWQKKSLEFRTISKMDGGRKSQLKGV